MNDTVINVKDISKCYQIYNASRDRLKQFVMPRVQRLVKRMPAQYYREFWAVKDVSFAVKRGETVGIVGHNGSGKSTLLQMICGTLSPSSGSIEVNGRVAALLELGSGFNPEFTGRENVYLNAALLGLSSSEIDERFDAIAAFADIGEFIGRPVKTYSSGMFVRLAFAVQAQVNPDIFIVDEALAVGDEKFQRKCYARMEEMKSNGASILFVSHSAASVMELCDRAMLLDHGERLMMGNPTTIIRAYQKLIYSPVNKQSDLIAQYKAIDQKSGAVTEDLSLDLNGSNDDSVLVTPDLEPVVASFDESLMPETTVSYPEQGARISDIEILDDFGKKVNILVQGNRYMIRIRGIFLVDRESVYFGFHIKTISGVEVTGQCYPAHGRSIDRVFMGERFSLTYYLTISLLPGVFFVGGGVWSTKEPNCLHRLLDKLMFKVVPRDLQYSFGFFDAACDVPSFERYYAEQ